VERSPLSLGSRLFLALADPTLSRLSPSFDIQVTKAKSTNDFIPTPFNFKLKTLLLLLLLAQNPSRSWSRSKNAKPKKKNPSWRCLSRRDKLYSKRKTPSYPPPLRPLSYLSASSMNSANRFEGKGAIILDSAPKRVSYAKSR